ncbi:glycoside hydrolase family 88 protein [Phycisphaerales bacterium AB-hyl4]|uniref:Glycoside hydrolase family 88 protein n=1 Tax=Natronomicrosphaera hydrolytica TaxID=3242702 RepID=A0ABV4U9P3_9BACT
MNTFTPSSTNPVTMPPLDLAVALYDHYESIDEVKHYYGLLAIYALARAAELIHDNTALLNRCRNILKRFPLEIKHPNYNFINYRIGGIPRAYMLYRGHMTDEATRIYVHEYAEQLMHSPRSDSGVVLNMRRQNEIARQMVWIDVAMPVTPFLLFAGLTFGQPDWIDEAARQTFLHYDELLNPDNGLLHQCKNFTVPGAVTDDHWGRGNGWGLIALTELVQYLPADSPHRRQAEQYFVDHTRALLPHQSPRGLWRQEIPLPTAWEESSGTGLILYGYGVGLRLGLLPADQFRPAFDRGIAGLRQHAIKADGSIELSCPGCRCPGEGERRGTVAAYVEDKQPYRDEPHGAAPLILALTEEARLNQSTNA